MGENMNHTTYALQDHQCSVGVIEVEVIFNVEEFTWKASSKLSHASTDVRTESREEYYLPIFGGIKANS